MTIYNTVPTAQVDLSTGDVVKDPKAAVGPLQARRVSSDTFEAIVVPQMLVNRVPLFEVICGDVSYLLETKFNFRSGVCHTVNLTLTSNPEKVRMRDCRLVSSLSEFSAVIDRILFPIIDGWADSCIRTGTIQESKVQFELQNTYEGFQIGGHGICGSVQR